MFTFGHDSLTSLDQALLQKIPFFSDINVSSPSPSFINLQTYEENYDPSSFLQEFLEHQREHHVTLEEDVVLAAKDHVLVNNMVEKSENSKAGLVIGNQRNKRSCKKDRHSKIDTAQGPRDRRMRLSLEVARKFFGLQDMLKFDKASKTVEWLLIQSRSAIEEIEATRGHLVLKRDNNNCNDDSSNKNNKDDDDDDDNTNISNSSVMMRSTTASSTTSECEVVSGNKMKQKKEKGTGTSTRKCRSHSSSSHSIIAKESREKARERAKQRTREKSWMKMVIMPRSNTDSHTENCEESGTQSGQNSNNKTRNPNSLDRHLVVEKMYYEDRLIGANQEMDGSHDSGSLGKWSPCPASSSFNCDQQSTGINIFSSERHDYFNEFPSFSKSWEGCPSQFLC